MTVQYSYYNKRNEKCLKLQFRYNKSFVHTFIKIKAIEQKTEATLLISRLNPLVGGRLCFAPPMVEYYQDSLSDLL